MSLLIVGGTAVDVIFPRVPRLPAWPEHLEFTGRNLVLLAEPPLVTIGGNGANAAFVAARCGADVTLHSNFANDSLGELARGWLAAAGCTVVSSARSGRTAVNVTAADRRLRRATFFYAGVAAVPPSLARAFAFALLCGWPHPKPRMMARTLQAWRAQGTQTALDIGPLLGPEPAWADLSPTLAQVDVLLANEHEALVVTGARALPAALRRLRAVCAGHLVIKLGRRGVLWLAPNANAPLHFAAPPAKAANTIGAGDSFNGALLAALDRGAKFPAALRTANRVAASVVRSPQGVLGFSSVH